MPVSEKKDHRETVLKAAVKLLEAVGAIWLTRHPRAPWIETLVLHLDQDGIRVGLREPRFREQPELLGEITSGMGKRLEDLRHDLLSVLPWTCLPFRMEARLEAYTNATCKAAEVSSICAGLADDSHGYFPRSLLHALDREAAVAAALGSPPDAPAVDWACLRTDPACRAPAKLSDVLQARSEEEAYLRVAARILSNNGFMAFLEGRLEDVSPFSLDELSETRLVRMPDETMAQGLARIRREPVHPPVPTFP